MSEKERMMHNCLTFILKRKNRNLMIDDFLKSGWKLLIK